MSQIVSITLTFNREGFSPFDYITSVAREDCIEIFSLNRCWSIAADLERLARNYNFENQNSFYIVDNIEFLKEVYLRVRGEMKLIKAGLKSTDGNTIWNKETYYQMLSEESRNLEWLLFFLTGRIAAAQMFEQLMDSCYIHGSKKNEWISMCEAWGNEKPEKFAILFSIC